MTAFAPVNHWCCRFWAYRPMAAQNYAHHYQCRKALLGILCKKSVHIFVLLACWQLPPHLALVDRGLVKEMATTLDVYAGETGLAFHVEIRSLVQTKKYKNTVCIQPGLFQ